MLGSVEDKETEHTPVGWTVLRLREEDGDGWLQIEVSVS